MSSKLPSIVMASNAGVSTSSSSAEQGMEASEDIVTICGDAPNATKYRISRSKLTAESTYFKGMFGGGFKESETDEIVLHEDDPTAIDVFLGALSQPDLMNHLQEYWEDAIKTSLSIDGRCLFDRVASGLSKHALKFVAMATHLYIVSKKYSCSSIHNLVITTILPQVWSVCFGHKCTHPVSSFRSRTYLNCSHPSDFLRYHFDILYDTYSEYPEPLWPIFLDALLHYQRVGRGGTELFDKLGEDTELAKFISLELAKKLLVKEKRCEELEQFEESYYQLREQADVLAKIAGPRRIPGLLPRGRPLFGHSSPLGVDNNSAW